MFVSFFIIRLARNASNKLNGIAKKRIPNGKTPIFPELIHINTNPANHERRVVCCNENFFAIINIAIAKHNDQIPQTAPFIGSDGNTSPSV